MKTKEYKERYRRRFCLLSGIEKTLFYLWIVLIRVVENKSGAMIFYGRINRWNPLTWVMLLFVLIIVFCIYVKDGKQGMKDMKDSFSDTFGEAEL